jgi:Effector Associated Constant Component 1
MEAQIQVAGGDSLNEIADLHEWLRRERALVGSVQFVRQPPGEGELGGTLDLAVALGSGGAGVALAKSLTTWLRTRRAKVTITVQTEGRSVMVSADVAHDQVLPMLEQVLRDGDA